MTTNEYCLPPLCALLMPCSAAQGTFQPLQNAFGAVWQTQGAVPVAPLDLLITDMNGQSLLLPCVFPFCACMCAASVDICVTLPADDQSFTPQCITALTSSWQGHHPKAGGRPLSVTSTVWHPRGSRAAVGGTAHPTGRCTACPAQACRSASRGHISRLWRNTRSSFHSSPHRRCTAHCVADPSSHHSRPDNTGSYKQGAPREADTTANEHASDGSADGGVAWQRQACGRDPDSSEIGCAIVGCQIAAAWRVSAISTLPLLSCALVCVHLCRQEATSTACREPCHEPWVWRPLKPGSTTKFLAKFHLILHWNLYPSWVCCCGLLFIVHITHSANSGSHCLISSKINHKTQSITSEQ